MRSRPLLVLFVGLLAVGMGQSFLFAVLPPLGRVLGLGEIQVGSIITASAVVYFFASPAWGRRSDVLGRRRVIVVGLAGYGVTMLLFTFVIQLRLWQLCSAGLAWGLLVLTRSGYAAVSSAVYPASQAYIADGTSAEDRTAGVAVMSSAFGAGNIVGPGLGGALTLFGLQAPLYFTSLFALAAGAVVWHLLPEPTRLAKPAGTTRLRAADRRILPFLILAFGVFLVLGSTQLIAGFYFQDRLGLDAAETTQRVGGALMAMATTSLFAQMVLVRRLRPRAETLLRFGLPISAAAFPLLLIADSYPGLLLGYLCFGLGIGLAIPGFGAGASLAVGADEQGAVAGFMSATPALSFIIAPVASAGLYRLRPDLPYLASVVLLALLSAFLFLGPLRRKDRCPDG